MGYGLTAWSNPYAMANDIYGNSSGGSGSPYGMNPGAMNGMGNGFSSVAANEFSPSGDGFAAALAEPERRSTKTMTRTRSRSAKSKSRHRLQRVAGVSR